MLTDADFDSSTCTKRQLQEFGGQHSDIAIEIAGVLQGCYQGIDTAYQECSSVDAFVNNNGIQVTLGQYDQTVLETIPNSEESIDCCQRGLESYALANDYIYDSEMSDPDDRWTYWCTEDKGGGRDCIQLTRSALPVDGPNWDACTIAVSHVSSGFIQ